MLNYSYFRTVLHKRLPITSRKRTVLHGTMLIISGLTTVLPGTVLITSYFRNMLQEAAMIINLLQKELCRTRFLQEFAVRGSADIFLQRTLMHKSILITSNFRNLLHKAVISH